jgi:hypothetical protein
MIRLKQGVRLRDLSPQMALAAAIVASCYGDFDCTITSANDSKHSARSYHYKGNALDFRTKDYAGDKAALERRVREALGAEFDAILEALGQDNEHLHVEYDPK